MRTIMSGIEKIDVLTGGFHPGELTLICSRPGMGKTTLLKRVILNTARTAVRNKRAKFVLYFNPAGTGLAEIPRFRGISNLQAEAVIVDATPAMSVDHIVEKFAILKKTHEISMVAIDYLQLLNQGESDPDKRLHGMVAIVSRLKELAVQEGITVLMNAVLTPLVENRQDYMSRPADISNFGDIKSLADMIMILHRPYHVVGVQGTQGVFLPGPTTFTVAKNSHGGVGFCKLALREFGNAADRFSWHWYVEDYRIRSHLRWLFFGSPDSDDGPKPEDSSNGYVINGYRMDKEGFDRLNTGLRWPILGNDPILDQDIARDFLDNKRLQKPEQYNAFCPLDGYVTAINAEYYWGLPPGERMNESGPDAVYRLCPHCLIELASRMMIRRSWHGNYSFR